MAVALSALASAVMGATGCGKSVAELPPPGPLRYDGDRWEYATPRDPGEVVTFSGAVVENTTRRDVVLEDVTLLDATEGLSVVGLLAAPVPVDAPFDPSSGGFPPEDQSSERLRALEGYVVPPGGKAQVFVGLRPGRDGRYGFRDMAVVYESEGERYTLELPWSYVICVSREAYEETGCSWPGGGE